MDPLLIKQEAEAIHWLSHEIWIYVGPVVIALATWAGILYYKTRFLNWIASWTIRADTNYDLHNDFELDGRHAKMWERNSQFVTIYFFDKMQTRKIGNREFIKTKVDINSPTRQEWTDAKREAYNTFLTVTNGSSKKEKVKEK